MVGMVDIVHSQALTTEHARSGLGMKLAISFVLRWNMELSDLNLHIYTWSCGGLVYIIYSEEVYNIDKGISHFKLLNSLSLTTCPMSPCTTSMVAFELVREGEDEMVQGQSVCSLTSLELLCSVCCQSG